MPPVAASRPLSDPTTMREVRRELLQFARLLRSTPADARGIARAERITASGVLIFESADAEELRRQLLQAISALHRADATAAPQLPTAIRRSTAQTGSR